MAKPDDRGRPSKAKVAARGDPEPLEIASQLPIIQPMICPMCRMGMTPRILRSGPDRRTVQCKQCARAMLLIYRVDGSTVVSRL